MYKHVKINIIVAANYDHVIGYNNQLPWHITEDLQFFKTTTLNHVIIMGRKTFTSIGKALPSRINIVISRNKDLIINNVLIFQDLFMVFEYLGNHYEDKQIFIIGGGEIFNLALPYVDCIYLTKINFPVNIDNSTIFFPQLNKNEWLIEDTHIINSSIGNIECKFQKLTKLT